MNTQIGGADGEAAPLDAKRGGLGQRVFCLILVVWAIGGAPQAKGADERPAPERATVPWRTGPIEIDGELTEPAWRAAATLRPFRLNDGSGAARESTRVQICYDNEALYLAWTCRDSDIQATFTARDSKFWEEEVAEFFITSGALERYFELQWNPLGGVFDAIIENELDEDGLSKRFAGEWGFTAENMTSAVKVDGTVGDSSDRDRGWRVEARVPFADLGVSAPSPGDVWRGNFYRFNREEGRPAELLSWSPTLLPSFHQPSRFGFLEFGDKPESR